MALSNTIACLLLFTSAHGINVRRQSLIPVRDQAELMRQETGGEMDRGMDKTEACQLLPGCADVACFPPFKLTRIEGQCCPTCEAPPDQVIVDEHKAMLGPSPSSQSAVQVKRLAPSQIPAASIASLL